MKKVLPHLTYNVKKHIKYNINKVNTIDNSLTLPSKVNENKVKKQIQQINFFSQVEKQDNLDIV